MTGFSILALLLAISIISAEQCGLPHFLPKLGNVYAYDRIIGGKFAYPNSWPWQVSLRSEQKHFCGGSLINHQWILTTAHCLVRESISDVYVQLGKHNLKFQEMGEITVPVARMIQHPNYHPDTGLHDIALVKLARAVDFTDKISPVCLPSSSKKFNFGEMVHVTGWGGDGVQERSFQLKQTMVPIVICSGEQHAIPVVPYTICSGYMSGGHNSCHGDNGGPLVYRLDGIWYIGGVSSSVSRICGVHEVPSVFTEVSAFNSWIQNTISSD